MSDQRNGGISWTDTTWNPVRGCSRVSEGCRECYAERIAARFSGPGQPYEGLAVLDDRGARWTGEVRLIEKHLDDPLRWTRPRRIFVNSMSDLFHEKLTNDQIARVFSVMAAASRHQFQVLTKRSKRMLEWFEWIGEDPPPSWPLPNVWLGVSVEHQDAANERIPDLLATPAAVRWLSVEPMLGPVAISGMTGLDWIVCGGESGPRARPMHPEWARSLRDQAVAAGVPFHFKQWGEWSPTGVKDGARTINVPHAEPLLVHTLIRLGKRAAGRELDGREWNEWPRTQGGPS